MKPQGDHDHCLSLTSNLTSHGEEYMHGHTIMDLQVQSSDHVFGLMLLPAVVLFPMSSKDDQKKEGNHDALSSRLREMVICNV